MTDSASFKKLSENLDKAFDSNNKRSSNELENDPILKSIMKFEDLNKQLCSNNLFTKIDSSISTTDINLHNGNKPNLPEVTVKFEPENNKYAHFDLGPNSENFMSECMKIINKKD